MSAPEQATLDTYARDLADVARVSGQDCGRTADPDGFGRASKAIAQLAKLGRPFDAGDVRAWAGPFESPNVIGAAFSAARKAGLIRSAGVTTSRAVSRHGGLVRLWQGVDVP